MYCNSCGKEVREGAAFCPHCGAPLSGGDEPVYYEEYEEEKAPAKRGLSSGVLIAIIAAVAIVIVAAILAFTMLTHGKQQAQIAQLETQQAVAAAQAEQAKQEAQQSTAQQESQAQTSSNSDAAAQEPAPPAQSEAQTVNNYYYYGTGYASGTYYSSVQSSGYLWPTNTQYITYADLSGYDSDTVAAIRNEIYARHGYAFQTDRWKNYFNSKSWYTRDSSCTQSVALSRMNKIEKANVDTIVQYEQDMGWK